MREKDITVKRYKKCLIRINVFLLLSSSDGGDTSTGGGVIFSPSSLKLTKCIPRYFMMAQALQ